MKKFVVKNTPLVKEDLLSIGRYFLDVGSETAFEFLDRLATASSVLSIAPRRCPLLRGKITKGKEIRQLLVGRYKVIFEVLDASVIVHRIVHGARVLKKIF